ncbi:mechanosensitive ion channel domain-containing protein [Allohahella marinimesophila]|uniref:Miniconductance mechanosensitive channel MscM n=1 Tax=Allohahella marinimesophila TaxID=1054972 RepID=A0ABP7NNI6_9GAMM
MHRLVVAVIFGLTLLAGQLAAAPPAAPTQIRDSDDSASPAQRAARDDVPSKAEIEAIKARIEARDIAEAEKQTLLERLEKTSVFKKQARTDRKQADEYQDRLDHGPEDLKTRELVTKTLQREKEPDLIAQDDALSAPLSDLEPAQIDELQQTLSGRLVKSETELQQLNSHLEDLTEELTELRARPDDARRELSEINDRLTRIDIALQTYDGQADTPTVEKAYSALVEDEGADDSADAPMAQTLSAFESLTERWALAAEALALSEKADRNQIELASQSLRGDLIEADRTLTAIKAERLTKLVRVLQQRIAELNIEEASRLKEDVKSDVQASGQKLGLADKVISRNQQTNLALSDDLLQRTQSTEVIDRNVAAANDELADIRERFRYTRSKVEVAGLSQALGQILLEERRQLREPRLQEARALTSQDLIARAGLSQIQNAEMRRDLRDLEDFAERLYRREKLKPAEMEQAEFVDMMIPVLETRRSILDELTSADQSYLQSLSELDYMLTQLDDVGESYQAFINERLLWIRSSPVVDGGMLLGIGTQVRELMRFQHWRGLLVDIRESLSAGLVWWVVAFLAFAAYLRRYSLKVMLRNYAVPLGRLSTDSFAWSAKALLVTILLALPWPVIFWSISMALEQTPLQSRPAVALTAALHGMVSLLFYLQVIRMLCVPDGIAVAHLRWPREHVEMIYRDLNRFLYLVLPLILVASFIINFDFGSGVGALPNLVPLLSLTALGYALVKLFSRDRGVIRIYLRYRHREASSRAHRFLIVSSILIPAALGGTALLGYLYTVGTVFVLISDTIFLLVALLVVHLLMVRGIILTQRKVAYKRAIEKRNAARLTARAAALPVTAPDEHEAVRNPEITAAVEAAVEAGQESGLDIAVLSKGMRELLSTVMLAAGAFGLWFIWEDVLPAFNIFEEVAIWQYTEGTGEEARIVPVTLFDLGLSIFVIVLTIFAARRIPALLEFAVLQRLAMGPGGSYTIRTLAGYLVVGIGIIVALAQVGANWSQIGWMAAALSVGIGFGLQEIVANFISGLIILFERPIRVGDVVTVGDTDGVVTRIKIRATTIRNWDNKELLVPNKEFITSRLLNWTLTDETTRLLIPVGIAYGSDPRKAMQIISDVATSHPNVLTEPAPLVTFEAFGDSALQIFLRAFVGELALRLPVATELITQIYEALNEAEISIAYPQRDVHLSTSQPLEMRVLRSGRLDESGKVVESSAT